MPAVTEVVTLCLKPNATVEDASSAAGQQMHRCLGILKAQKGFQRQYWGRQLEDSSLLVWSIDWDDISDHHNFIKSEGYKEFLALLSPIADLEPTKIFAFHANFASHPPNAPREAPVTEFAFLALPTNANTEVKSALEDHALKLVQAAETDGPAIGVATGWAMEEFEHEKGAHGKANVLVLCLGWPTKEDHETFRAHASFVKSITPIRGMVLPFRPGQNGTTTYHAKLIKG